ncbi:uncharacterized protein LOC132205109 [Neocloeon triangulifer]|uniref:uncharacterized protein LOC132205109 n=1 Tax=Neocloeon triangulifer TaxID=2078957 RepID=UPI00286EBD50|nr:uncharacterized protein LOC132205109 [Neocloeon triangulifer]
MLKLMELVTQDTPSTMDQGFKVYDQCSTVTGNDECDLAARTYDCGVEKMPNITQNMVNVGKGSPVVLTPPIECVPVLRSCVTANSVSCVANPTLINELTNSNQTSMGTLIWTKFYNKRIFLSISSNNTNIEAPYNYCCSIGMKLIEFRNSTELNDFIVSTASILSSNVGYLYISEVKALGYQKEFWCGTGVQLDVSVYQNKYATIPAMACEPNIYMLQRLNLPNGTTYVLALTGSNFSTAANLTAFACQ